jgi:hypothetical protein
VVIDPIVARHLKVKENDQYKRRKMTGSRKIAKSPAKNNSLRARIFSSVGVEFIAKVEEIVA